MQAWQSLLACGMKNGDYFSRCWRGDTAPVDQIRPDTQNSALQRDNIRSFNPAKYLLTSQQQEAVEVWKKER